MTEVSLNDVVFELQEQIVENSQQKVRQEIRLERATMLDDCDVCYNFTIVFIQIKSTIGWR